MIMPHTVMTLNLKKKSLIFPILQITEFSDGKQFA